MGGGGGDGGAGSEGGNRYLRAASCGLSCLSWLVVSKVSHLQAMPGFFSESIVEQNGRW